MQRLAPLEARALRLNQDARGFALYQLSTYVRSQRLAYLFMRRLFARGAFVTPTDWPGLRRASEQSCFSDRGGQMGRWEGNQNFGKSVLGYIDVGFCI